MNYTDVTHIMDMLESTDGSVVITPANISGYVEHTRSINAADDIVPGTVNTADISVTVLDIQGSASAYMGREFRYRKGYADSTSRSKISGRVDTYVSRGPLEIYTRKRQLTQSSPAGEFTINISESAGALVLDGPFLKILYPVAPYVEIYEMVSLETANPAVPDLTTYERNIAVEYAQEGVSYRVEENLVVAYQVFCINQKCYVDSTWYEMHDRGLFTADRPKRGTGGQFSISAYDRMTRFEGDFIAIFNGVTSGSDTAGQILEKLCIAAKVPLAQQTRHNELMKVAVPEDQESLTGTQVLTWLGEIMGCSWRINSAGELESAWYKKSPVKLTRNDYQTFDYEAYKVATVEKVMTGSAYAESTGFAGTGANTLVISGNSLLPYTTEDDLARYSQGILDILSTIPVYRPGVMNGYANPTLSPGDILDVENDDGVAESVCVTQISENGFILSITSSGNPKRATQNFGNLSNAALKKTIAELQQQVGAFPEQWEKSISDTVASITGAMGGTRVDLFKPGTKQPSGTAYLYDSNDIKTAKKLLVLNAGGIAYYDNGFNVDDPSLSVPSFVVMDNQGRVNAAAIMVGILTAIRIQSADGKSFWDLNTGDASFRGSIESKADVGGERSVLSSGGIWREKNNGEKRGLYTNTDRKTICNVDGLLINTGADWGERAVVYANQSGYLHADGTIDAGADLNAAGELHVGGNAHTKNLNVRGRLHVTDESEGSVSLGRDSQGFRYLAFNGTPAVWLDRSGTVNADIRVFNGKELTWIWAPDLNSWVLAAAE